MGEKKKKSGWKKIRSAFREVHLWLGLVCGLVVIVVCFSGTVYVYNTELRELASPELYRLKASESGSAMQTEDLISAVENATGARLVALRIPAEAGRTWQFTMRKEGEEGRGTTYAVNPYTAEIVGNITATQTGTSEFLRSMFSLHRWLLLDRIEEPIFGELPNRKLGSYVTGTATILFTLGLLTGLVIWFPSKLKSWKQGLVIKYNANWKRINHDLHNTLAFYSFIFLLLMGLTGPQWSFEWYRTGLRKTLGTYQDPAAPRPAQAVSALPSDTAAVSRVGIATWLSSAGEALPYEGDWLISLPANPEATVAVSKYKTGFFAPAAPDRLLLDQYTGQVLSRDIFSEKPFNERLSGSIKAIHVGDVYGKFTKLLYFFACLVATSLPVTGTIIWVNKLNKRKAKKKPKRPRQKVRKQAAPAE